MTGQVVTRDSMDALTRDEYAHPARRAPRKKKKRKGKRKPQARQLPPIARAMVP